MLSVRMSLTTLESLLQVLHDLDEVGLRPPS